jgi:hypothetical protein
LADHDRMSVGGFEAGAHLRAFGDVGRVRGGAVILGCLPKERTMNDQVQFRPGRKRVRVGVFDGSSDSANKQTVNLTFRFSMNKSRRPITA